MGVSPFQLAIEATLKPLEFAARDDFAHLGRVQELEAAVAGAAARALALAIPRDVRRVLERVAKAFAEPLAEPQRARVIRRALAALRPLTEPAWCDDALARPPTALPGVGPQRAELLARRGLRSVGDLLFQLPARYDDRRSLVRVGDLEVGRRVTFIARVVVCDFVARRGRAWGGRIFEAVVEDDSGSVHLKWFRGGETIAKTVRKGALLLVTGDVKRYRFAKELLHPEIEPCGDEEGREPVDLDALRSVVPGYPALEGLHPLALRRIVRHALEQYADLVPGHLPASLMRERGLPDAFSCGLLEERGVR